MERMDEFVRTCNEMSAEGRLPPGRELTLDDFIMPLTHPSCQLCYDQIVMKASKIDAAIAADEGAYRSGRPKKRKLDADEDDYDDANADSSSTPWPEVHKHAYEEAAVEYRPCHKNEFANCLQMQSFLQVYDPSSPRMCVVL